MKRFDEVSLQLSHNQLTSDDATSVLQLVAKVPSCSLRRLDFDVSLRCAFRWLLRDWNHCKTWKIAYCCSGVPRGGGVRGVYWIFRILL